MDVAERIAKRAEAHTSAWDTTEGAAKVIVMEKVVKDDKPARLGALERYTYKSLDEQQARQRAVRALKRIGEDPLHWKELPA